jgi:ABC-type nitrate/sulfonate/bicarbonate transport system substrate-binding protein
MPLEPSRSLLPAPSPHGARLGRGTRRSALSLGVALALLAACQSPPATTTESAPTARAPAEAPAAAASGSTAAASADSYVVAPRTIRIAYTTDGLQFLPLRIAEVEGLFARRGLQVELQRVDANAGLAGMTTGQFEYMGSFGRIINANMHGIPMRFTGMLVDRPMHVLVARPENKTIADLRGKTVGSSSPGGVEDFVVRAILKGGGLEPDRDVNVLPAGRTGSIPALESGQFAAIGGQPPQSTLLETRGYNIVGHAAALLPDLALTATGTTADRVAKEPGEVKAFVAAFLESLRFLHTDREGAARVAAEWLDIPLDIARLAYDQSIETFSKDGSFAEATLRRGVEIESEKDPSLNWNRPLSEMVAGDVLTEVQRSLGMAAQ